MSKISVIIPSFNRASLIGATIENMLAQTLPPFEVIVVDDGSTDNSVSVINSFGNRVKLITQTNQGPGPARNAGLGMATGDLIQFMDSDDLASLNKLEVQSKALAESGADFAYGPWVRANVENNQITFLDEILQANPLPPGKSMLEWFLSGWSLVFQNCMFKRSILDKAGKYRTDLMPSEDSEYFLRILLAGAQPVHTPECLVIYREHNINKITGAGTNPNQRANDWTRFLTITGNLVKEILPGLRYDTRLALAAGIDNHLEYCRKNGLSGLPVNNPYNHIPGTGQITIAMYRMYQRFLRKIKNTPDFHPGFNTAEVGPREKALVNQMGYQN